MRTEQLEALEAVIHYGSMRRASEMLHLSQPALSQTISTLERDLGVTLLDRHRAGARVSARGRELLPLISEVLDAVRQLQATADDQAAARSVIRVGTVNAATVPLLAPALREFRAAREHTQVELLNVRQADIHVSLLDGSLDVGLVNVLAGDDAAPDLTTVELLRGTAVVCCRSDSPMARLPIVTVPQLFAETFVAMRTGYVMHRYAHRLLDGAHESFAYSADGAEMGKLMVAEGLGVTLLPDYSVIGDPLERSGVITYRPLAADDAAVVLLAQYARTRHLPTAVRHLIGLLRRHAAGMRNAA